MAMYAQRGPDRSMIQAFRGAAKSWISAVIALRWLYIWPDDNVVVISAAKQRSDAFTQFCLRLIEEIPALAKLRPREGQRRSMVGFDVGPSRANQTPSMVSIGISGMMTGNRADLLIADDVEIPNNSETVTLREKLAERVKEFDALLKPGGKILYLGTPQSEDSIYRRLPERGFDLRIWPILYPDEKQIAAYGGNLAPSLAAALERKPSLVGRSTEPTRFTDSHISKLQLSYGRQGFSLQFMLDPRLSDMDLYPLRMSDLMVHSLDFSVAPERLIWTSDPEHVIADLPNVGFRGDNLYAALMLKETRHLPYTGVVMAVDPGGRGKDETAYAVVSSLNGMLFLLDSGGFQGYDESTMSALASVAKRFGVNEVVIEPNFGDGMFQALANPVFQRIYPCKLTESERSTGQKERRICDVLEPVITSHRLVVHRDLLKRDFESTMSRPPELQQRYRLFFQLTRITRERGALVNDDRLDALALAVAYWQKAVSREVEKAARERLERDQMREIEAFVRSHKKGGPVSRFRNLCPHG